MPTDGRDAWLDALDSDAPAVGVPKIALYAPLLAVENVEVRYGVSLAVRGVSFEVPENGAVALLGPNGAGKTTLIRAISGLLDVHHGAVRNGDIRLAGRSIRGLRADTGGRKPSDARKPSIGSGPRCRRGRRPLGRRVRRPRRRR